MDSCDFDNSSAGFDSKITFVKLNNHEKLEHIRNLWKNVYVKAKAAAEVLQFFNGLQRKIYLFGATIH